MIDKIKNNKEENKIILFKNIVLESYYLKINKYKISYLKLIIYF